MNMSISRVGQSGIRFSSQKPATTKTNIPPAAPQFSGNQNTARPLTTMMALAAMGLSSLGMLGTSPARVYADPPAATQGTTQNAVVKERLQDVKDRYALTTYLTQRVRELQANSLQEIAATQDPKSQPGLKGRVLESLKESMTYTEIAKYIYEQASQYEKDTKGDETANKEAKINLNKAKQAVQMSVDAQNDHVKIAIDNNILTQEEVKETLSKITSEMEDLKKRDGAYQEMLMLTTLSSYMAMDAMKTHSVVGQIAETPYKSVMRDQLRAIAKFTRNSAHFQEKAETLGKRAQNDDAKKQIGELQKTMTICVDQVKFIQTKAVEVAEKMGIPKDEINKIFESKK